MTWTRLGDDLLDSPALVDLDRSTRLLHVEVLIYCNRHGLDGTLTRRLLPRATDHVAPETAAAELVDAGLWSQTDDGWQLDWSEQETAETVRRRRDQNATYQRRHRLHLAGDHSLCTRCRYVTRDESADVRPDQRAESGDPHPSHPHPSPPHPGRSPRGGGGKADEPAGAGAPPVAADEGRPLGCVNCHAGWLGEDDDGRPIPCPTCRAHLTRGSAGHLTVIPKEPA